MMRLDYRSLLVLLLLLPGSLLAAEPAGIVRVLSYNIHHGEGTDGELDLEQIARVIRSVEPDLVSLQEVDCKTNRTEKVDQPAALAKLTEMRYVFGNNIPHDGGRYGNAVLSRWPILRSENYPLPSHYQGEQRGVLEVEVQPPGEMPSLLFFATHFDYRADSLERIASAKMVNDLMNKRSDTPAILTGDLNAEPTSRTLSLLGHEWRQVNEADLFTFPAGSPMKQIDYVLFRPTSRWRVVKVEVLPEAVASDHRAIFAVLEMLGQ